jgi:hypothetical protein
LEYDSESDASDAEEEGGDRRKRKKRKKEDDLDMMKWVWKGEEGDYAGDQGPLLKSNVLFPLMTRFWPMKV